MSEKREIPSTGILKPWVAKLPLREQGCLLTVIRGCDTTEKEEDSKRVTRALRGLLLFTHAADEEKSKSFIEVVAPGVLELRLANVRKSHDHLPHHFLMHLIHAVQIIGVRHPDRKIRAVCWDFYCGMCRAFHMLAEKPDAMIRRLGADEETFFKQQQ